MWLTSPISWPISKVLDWLLGEETALFRRAELRALVTMHAEDSTGESMLTAEEVTVIHGALDMANKTAEVAMTPLEKVFMVSADAILDRELLGKILEHGHSRIPVYEGTDKKNIIGLILVKELVLADLDKGLKVRECRLREIDHIVADTPLYSVLELFRFKRRHMAALTKGQEGSVHLRASLFASAGDKSVTMGELGSLKDETVGIITIEDVIEELLQHEIVDETDVYIDNTQTETVGPRTAAQPLPPKLSKYISYRKKRGELSARPSPSKPQNRPAVVAAAAAGAYAAIRKASVPPPDVAQWVGPVSVPSRPQSSATGVLPPLDDAEVTVGVPGSKKEGKGATGEGGVPAPQPPPPPPDIQ